MKKSIFVKALAILTATVLLIASFAGCAGNESGTSNSTASTADKADSSTADVVYRTLDEIKSSGKIKIGVFSDKNPFGYVDENGEYQGYDVYFANRLVKDLGVDVEFVSTEAASRVEFLETGKVDIVLANFTVTDERAEKVDFALPYMNVALGVVSPDSRVIKNLDELPPRLISPKNIPTSSSRSTTLTPTRKPRLKTVRLPRGQTITPR